MAILSAQYTFIRPDILLTVKVDTETLHQQIMMQHIDIAEGTVFRDEMISCIHTAIASVPESSTIAEEDEIFITSSEENQDISISPEDSFFALKSWVEAIADMGTDAFRLQSEIENIGHLGISLSSQLLRFVASH